MKKNDIEERTRELVLPILEQFGLELWDVEYVKEGQDMFLRAYIDKKDGVTIDDCEVVSRALDKELDREDFIKDAYILEVSSPGLTRPLKKTVDFTRSIGKLIEVKLYHSLSDEKESDPAEKKPGKDPGKEFEAVLLFADDERITVKNGDFEYSIPRSNLAKARLCYVEKELND